MKKIDRRRFLTAAASGAILSASLRGAHAADWPGDKVIRGIVPFGAGSSTDVIARILMQEVSAKIGQTIIIENRGGAGGSIGSAMVAKSEPDGYTLLLQSSAHSAAPAVYPDLAYDPARDFSGIALFGVVPNVLLVAPSNNIKSVQDLVARAKTSDLTFASSGVGSATHWAAERFLVSAGIHATHVPFSGGPAALTEVMTGRVDFCFIGSSSAGPFIKDGRLLALAVSSAKRSVILPDLPTTVELGFPDSDYTFWNGLLVPAKTPRPIIDRLSAEVQNALALPDIQAKLATQGSEPLAMTPSEFDAMIAKEIVANIKLVQAAGLKFN